MYLQWCKLDHPENDGYPLFYQPQLDRFYFRQLCYEDPFCLGYIIIGPRGFGKTAEEVACQLDNMTKPGHLRNAAIQSKSAEDAESIIFQQKMVPMFNSFPDFFKPEYSHGSDPKNTMVFRRPSIRGKKRKIQYGDNFELGNSIKCYPPQNKALDGTTLSDLIQDEVAKLKPDKEMDAYKRHQVNVRTVFRNKVKRGIIRMTTTVEEMEEGGEQCHEIWDESNPEKRDSNGYTVSKLYKFFVSAVDTQTDIVTKYGEIPHDEAYQIIINEREPHIGNNDKLAPIIRKNPLNENESFIKAQNQSVYDVIILNSRLVELNKQKAEKKYRRYFIEWVNGEVDGNVELIEHPDGPLTLFYSPDEYWGKNVGGRKILNACTVEFDDLGRKQWKPCNNDLFRCSSDPIRYIKTDDPRASKMAAHGMMMFIPDLDAGKDEDEYISKNLMWEYCDRHTDPELDYENVIKLMRLFGHSIMPEVNAGDFYKHLMSRGYKNFIILRKNFTAEILTSKLTKNSLNKDNPVSSNTEVIESYVRRTAAFIRKYGHRINSIPLIKQLIEFDPKNPTKYDLAVSFGYAILAIEADLDYYDTDQKAVKLVMEYFKTYDISGNQSRLIQPVLEGEDDMENFPPDFFTR